MSAAKWKCMKTAGLKLYFLPWRFLSCKPDSRNGERQSYCPQCDCQPQRRTLRQRQRWQKTAQRFDPSEPPNGSRRLQSASVISDADIRVENPVIIGLISMITGMKDIEDIQRVYR